MTENHYLAAYLARAREFIATCASNSSSGLPDGGGSRFNQLALELFALQFKAIAPYRKLCLARGATPESINSWTEIPAIPTSAFKLCEMTSLPAAERVKEFHSSGTTEAVSSRHYHSPDTLALYEASLLPWFNRHLTGTMNLGGGHEKCRMILLTPRPEQAPHSSLVHMLEAVRREFGGRDSVWAGAIDRQRAWSLDFDLAVRSLHQAEREHAPILVMGTAFSFVHLTDFCAAQQLAFALPAASTAMETGGYKGRSRALSKTDLHGQIRRTLGISEERMVGEYGMCELSSQAYDSVCPTIHEPWSVNGGTSRCQPRCFHFPPWARARVVSPENGAVVGEGETGLVQVFDLANAASVLAVQTEDLGQPCGDGFVLLGRAAASEPRGCSLMASSSP